MGWPYQVCIDRATLLTGVFASGTTTWTVPYKDTTLDSIVLGPDFGTFAGTVVDVASAVVSGATTLVTATGNYATGVAAVGRSYLSRVRLSTPQLKDGRGFATNGVELWLEEINPVFQDLGSVTFRRSMSGVDDTEQTISEIGFDTFKNAKARLLFNGAMDDTTIYVESTSPKPFVLTSIEYLVQATNRDD